jgi:hypothetical protein
MPADRPPIPAATPRRRRRVPGARRFAAGALAAVVAVFGVLALRVRAGHDPALGSTKASAAGATTTSGSSSSSVDPYDSGTGEDGGSSFPSGHDGSSSSSSQAQQQSSTPAPTTHAS